MDLRGTGGYGEVDQVYVLVTGADILKLYPRWPVKLHGVPDVFAPFAGESYLQSGLFEDLTGGGAVRELVSLYVRLELHTLAVYAFISDCPRMSPK